MTRRLAFVVILLLCPLAAARAAPTEPVSRAADWLALRQQPNGAFFTATQPADATGETLTALGAADRRGEAVERALRYLSDNGPARATRAAYTGRMVSGMVAVGADPRSLGGVDYVRLLTSFFNPVTGAYDSNFYANALAVLGVLAAREPLPDRAVAYLRANQCAAGGFAWMEGCGVGPDVDTTAAVISALRGAGLAVSDVSVDRARRWLLLAQNADGGFGALVGEPTNANSTGLALSAIAALGEDPAATPWRRADGATAIGALLALQTASGGFRYRATQASPNDYATVQALPGAAGRALPVRPAPPTPRPTAAPTPEPSQPRMEIGGDPQPTAIGRAQVTDGTVAVTLRHASEAGATTTLWAGARDERDRVVSSDPVQVAGPADARFRLPVEGLAEGPLEVWVAEGTRRLASVVVTLDLTSPATQVSTPEDSVFASVPVVEAGNLRVEGTTTDEGGVRAVALVFRNRTTGASYGPWTAKRSGSPTHTSWRLEGYALEPGRYEVEVYGIDEAMNVEDGPRLRIAVA